MAPVIVVVAVVVIAAAAIAAIPGRRQRVELQPPRLVLVISDNA
jgi:hypothetical protein